MEVLYLSDISQLDYISQYESKVLMTGDILIAHELSKKNIYFINEWEFISENSIKNNWDQSYALSKQWCDENKRYFNHDGISYSECIQQDLIYPFEAVLNSTEVYKNIFNKFGIKKIYGYFETPTAVISTGPFPTYKAVRSISESVLFQIADNLKIEVIKLKAPQIEFNKPSEFTKKINLKKKFINVNKKNSSKGTIIIWNDFFPEKEYLNLVELTALNNSFDFVPVSREILKSLDINKSISFLNFNSLDLNNLNDLNIQFFSSKYFKFQIEKIFSEYYESIEILKTFENIFYVLKPNLIIFGHDAFIQERVIQKFLKNANSPTLSFYHDSIGCDFGYRGLAGNADLFLVWNEYSKKNILKYRSLSDKIFVNGSLRFKDEINSYKDFHDTSYKKNVLILTAAINCGYAAPVSDPIIHLNNLLELYNFIKEKSDFNFYIKPHPSFDYYHLYINIFSSLKNVKFLDNIPISSLENKFDICLLVNYLTTAAIEAMLINIPVFFIESAIYNIEDWRNPLPIYKTNRFNSFENFRIAFEKFYTNNLYRNHSLIHQKRLLDFLINTNSEDIEKNTINNILSIYRHSDKSFFKNDQKFNKKKILLFQEICCNNNIFTHLFKIVNNDFIEYINLFHLAKFSSKQKFPTLSIIYILPLLFLNFNKFKIYIKYYILSLINI
jgi:hypothetical protein